eukprot:TRINITY_DN70101_c0_g1_i1.p1 TRINITY_DN70101_c0_g1~~TRINITY_DN70101_c0_g1_i1.p1  ORF type:complete len:908 (+),score=307.11 TRINITY_DN70101_c0_g1_i1:79-2724(+)
MLALIGAAALVAAADQQALTAQLCNPKDPGQQWDFRNGMIMQRGTSECVDIQNYATSSQSAVWLYACHPQDKDPSHQNQEFVLDPSSHEIYVPDNGTAKGMRLDCEEYCSNGPGSAVWMFTRTGAANQQWAYDASTGLIKSMQDKYAKDLCISSTNAPPVRPCDVSPGKDQPWCNYSLPMDERVADLVSRIPANRIVGLFVNGASGVPELNIPAYQWWSEALHGVGHSPGVHFTGKTPAATSFPQVILTSSTFNNTLFRAIGDAVGTEGRVFSNYNNAGNTFWAPNINIYRDPRWGRGQETQGEDPTVNGEYAANFVSGFQSGEDLKHIKSSSCLKHFAAYNLENWHGVDRHHFDAKVSEQDLADTYYPPFEAGVKKGRASGIMCSYNAVNGVPSCANKPLLTDLARNTWGFDGYITSDCGAVADIPNNHKYETDSSKAIKDVLEAGMDSDCGGYLTKYMQKAIDSGVVTKDDYNTALSHMFRMRMRIGHFDPVDVQPYLKYDTDKVNTAQHQELAVEAARQGIVLLKNDNKALPFSQGTVKSIALVGPHGEATSVMQGNYQGTAPYLISPLDGLKKFADVTSKKGCDVSSSDKSGFAAATDAAAAADATVLIMGLDQGQESEGHDRTNVTLPGVQYEFIDAVASKAKGKVVLVIMSGGMVDISVAKADPRISAILWAGYPGQSGGQALAEILFGIVNPSGKLTQTWYPFSYLDKCSMFDMNMRPNTTTGCPGRSHRFYTGPTIFKFGDGMSYTSFEHTVEPAAADIVVDHSKVAAMLRDPKAAETPVATVRASVSNVGDRSGAEVSLMMVRPPRPGFRGAPVQNLQGYRRTFLAPGESQPLTFTLAAKDLAYADEAGQLGTEPGEWTVAVGGAIAKVRLQ